jgi:hypothetical protein
MQSTLVLIKNPNFLILCIVHGLNIGLSIAWNGLMNQAMTPYGYDNHQVGNIAAVSIVAGSLGCGKFFFFSCCIILNFVYSYLWSSS